MAFKKRGTFACFFFLFFFLVHQLLQPCTSGVLRTEEFCFRPTNLPRKGHRAVRATGVGLRCDEFPSGGWAFTRFARLPSPAGSFPFLDRSFSVRFEVEFRVSADLYAHIPYSIRYRYSRDVSCFSVTGSLVKVLESPTLL